MRFFLAAMLAALSCPLFAASPVSDAATPFDSVVPVLDLPAIDVDKALAEDLAKTKEQPGPVRYALGHAVAGLSLTPDASQGGSWKTLADGRLAWSLEIHAKDATSIDLGFSKFRLPHGAELRVVDVHTGIAAGPFTDADNPSAGQFWTPIQQTDRVRLELTLPEAKRAFLWLTLDTVHHGYKDLVSGVMKSGSCNVDVICPAGDDWRSEIRAVGVVAYNNSGNRSGNGCSGTFVRSTAPHTGPLFLSANHCEIDAASARVYFNFQNSTCRAVGSPASGQDGDGPLTQSIFGGTMLAQADPANTASIAASDFALVRFNSALPPSANVYLAGWDRRNIAPTSATSIHHPSGDEKRISFENDPLAISAYSGAPGGGNTHLRVADWDLGTTEQGSSGSGLWNQDHRLVGVLSGGGAACGNDEPDWYGSLAHAWEGLGTPQRRLRDWLDNGNTQVQTLDGVNATCQLEVTLDSPGFAGTATVGSNVRIEAAVSGATGTLSYRWQVDSDGGVDRVTGANNITATYPTAGPRQVRVEVTDATGCIGQANRALDIVGPSIVATGGVPQQVCGDNDAAMEPGERWRIPVTLRNSGGGALPAGGRALFVEGSSTASLPLGPNTFGYSGSTSSSGNCGYSFVDIASGADAVPALATDDPDDGRATNTIQLGGTGIELYGMRYARAVMSTNGFISLSEAETGEEYFNDCSGALGEGGAGPQLRVHHDDLVVPSATGAGLRYRYYTGCPRLAESDATPQGCHVFQWSRMQRYAQSGAVGDFEFQAVVYERSGQITYQYRTAAPDAGGGATIGITSPTGTDPLNAACNTSNAAPAQSAICLFKPGATPGGDPGLRVEIPAVSVPALAAGAQTVVDVPIAFATTGVCGATFALNYRGTAAPGVSSPGNAAMTQVALGAGGACQTSNACPAQVPTIVARQGLYSNPARGGNGLANFIYGNAAYGGAWYTALTDRTPTWYILAGDYAENLAAVPITRVRNGTGNTVGVATVSETVGQAWVAQVDADNTVHAWELAGGTTGIELMQSQGLPFTTPNHTQTWYAPTQSGWGLAIESLRPTPASVLEFIGAYVYDTGGTARWLTGSSDNITGGPINLTAYSVHCPGCPWLPDWASTGQPAGTLTRDYSGPINGTLSTAIVLPAPLSGNWTRSPLPITTIGTPVPAASPSGDE